MIFCWRGEQVVSAFNFYELGMTWRAAVDNVGVGDAVGHGS